MASYFCKHCNEEFVYAANAEKHEAKCALVYAAHAIKEEVKCGIVYPASAEEVKRLRYKCTFCSVVMSEKDALLAHVELCRREFGDAPAKTRDPPSSVACARCSRSFAHKCKLLRHLKSCIPESLNLTKRTRKKHVPCPVEDCELSFFNHTPLLEHLQNSHGVDIEMKPVVNKIFSSFEEFYQWKEEEEINSYSYFVKRTPRDFKTSTLIYYYCQRSGTARPNPNKKGVHTLTRTSVKSGQHCMARMALRINKETGLISLEYQPTHSHTVSPEDTVQHRLPHSMNSYINEQVATGATTDVIYEDVKAKFLSEDTINLPIYSNLRNRIKCRVTARDGSMIRDHSDTNSKKKMKCLVGDCEWHFINRNHLVEHMSKYHAGAIALKPVFKRSFSSFEEFYQWKEEEELSTYSYFVKKSPRDLKTSLIYYFYCQKSGMPRQESLNKTGRKLMKGSVKCGAKCIARMTLRIEKASGAISLEYHPNHSHELSEKDFIHHPLPRSINRYINDQVSLGSSTEYIFQGVKTHFFANTDMNLRALRCRIRTRVNRAKTLANNPPLEHTYEDYSEYDPGPTYGNYESANYSTLTNVQPHTAELATYTQLPPAIPQKTEHVDSNDVGRQSMQQNPKLEADISYKLEGIRTSTSAINTRLKLNSSIKASLEQLGTQDYSTLSSTTLAFIDNALTECVQKIQSEAQQVGFSTNHLLKTQVQFQHRKRPPKKRKNAERKEKRGKQMKVHEVQEENIQIMYIDNMDMGDMQYQYYQKL